MLIDFGNDFADADNGAKVLNGTYNTAAPFIQLLSTTNNTAEAHTDFIKVRGNGGSGSSALGASTSNIKQTASNVGRKIKKAVIIGAAVGGAVLLLLIACCCFCLCRRRSSSSRGLAVPNWPGSSTSYRPLGAPAPAAAVDVPYPSDGYRPPQYGAGKY